MDDVVGVLWTRLNKMSRPRIFFRAVFFCSMAESRLGAQVAEGGQEKIGLDLNASHPKSPKERLSFQLRK